MKLITLKRDPNIKINNAVTYYLNPDYIYIPTRETWLENTEFIYKKEIRK